MLLLQYVHRGVGNAKRECQVVVYLMMNEQYEALSGQKIQSASYHSMQLSVLAYKLLTGKSLEASMH